MSEAAARSAPDRSIGEGLLRASPWAAVALLTLVNTINYLDRTLPMILAEQLKLDLGLSDTELGILNGVGFTLVYAIAGIPIARVADRGRYGAVIGASLAVWSLMTAAASIVTSGAMLALTRLGVAVGEAGNTPAAHAYVSRKFRPEARAAPLAVLTMGTAFGSMIGLVGGGLLGEYLGWRLTMLVMGAIGLAMAPIVLLAIGPGQPVPAHESKSIREVFGHLGKLSVVALLVAIGFMAMSAYALGAFAPAFLMRVHGMSMGTTGITLGLTNGIIGIIALLTTGRIATHLTRRDPRAAIAVLIAFILISIPITIAAVTVPRQWAAISCMGLSYGVMATFLALTVSSLHSLVPIAMRAQASAALLFCSAAIGGFGPVIVGMISDRLTPIYGPQGLGWAMLVVPLGLLLGAACYAAALVNFRRDMVDDA